MILLLQENDNFSHREWFLFYNKRMRLPMNLGLKIYLCLFAVIAGASLTALLTPDGTTFIYYHTLRTFHPPASIYYTMAIFDAALSCLISVVLFRKAFNLPPLYESSLRILFALRVAGLFLGHNYEFVSLKASFHGAPLMGWITLGIWGLFIFPSFKEHYLYAFKK